MYIILKFRIRVWYITNACMCFNFIKYANLILLMLQIPDTISLIWTIFDIQDGLYACIVNLKKKKTFDI